MFGGSYPFNGENMRQALNIFYYRGNKLVQGVMSTEESDMTSPDALYKEQYTGVVDNTDPLIVSFEAPSYADKNKDVRIVFERIPGIDLIPGQKVCFFTYKN